MPRMFDLFDIVAKFSMSNWTVHRPPAGVQKECYILESEKLTVFIKFDVRISLLKYLGELGIAPRVLDSGEVNRVSYVVQEYLIGATPNRGWFTANLEQIANFIKSYHNDSGLMAMLHKPESYAVHVHSEALWLENRLIKLKTSALNSPETIAAFEKFKEQAQYLQPSELVPTHADPNTTNMLITQDRFIMLDWDEVTLSDPMRDIGVMLWWYVRPEQWTDFLTVYGLTLDEPLSHRIYWWSAYRSFAIALWQAEHGHDCAAFLEDFIAALSKKDNPQFSSTSRPEAHPTQLKPLA